MKPDSGYIAYIINPKSGATGTRPGAVLFKQYLTKNGFDVRVSVTTSLAHACNLATDAAVDYKCAMVVAVGGDGTIREVCHGLEGSDKPLLIIPSGTENLLANELALDARLKTILAAFESGEIRTLDLGSANGRCFTSIAGFGFDGDVVHRMHRQRTGHINHFDYFWPIWRAFWTYAFPPINVNVDGQQVFQGRALVFVGNISRYAIGLQLLHRADYSDGLLDVCIYKCASKLHLLKHAAMTILKLHTSGKDVIYRQGTAVTITSNAPNIATEIDGDPGPALPMEIKVIPKAVNILVPKHAKPTGIRRRIVRAIK